MFVVYALVNLLFVFGFGIVVFVFVGVWMYECVCVRLFVVCSYCSISFCCRVFVICCLHLDMCVLNRTLT